MTIDEMRNKKKEYGLSYERISDLSGVPLSTIQKIFSGQTDAPRYATLWALEKMFASLEYSRPDRGGGLIKEAEFAYVANAQKQDNDQADTEEPLVDVRYETIDGVIYALSSPTAVHQRIVFKLARILGDKIEARSSTCEVGIAPMDFQLREDDAGTVVQPDIYVVCDRSKNRNGTFVGAPDLAVEVLSDSSAKKDMGIKSIKYRDAGVREYWMIDYDGGYVFVNDFEGGKPQAVYGLRDMIPLTVSGGETVIDFAEVDDYVKRFSGGN